MNPRVMAALAQPAIGYLDPAFVTMMEELKELMRYAYQTSNPLTFPLSGRGRWAWRPASSISSSRATRSSSAATASSAGA